MPASQQLHAALWALSVGGFLLIAVYFTVRSGWFRKAGDDLVPETDVVPEPIGEVHPFAENLAESHGPVPFVLKLVIWSYLAFVVVYVYLYFRAMGNGLAAFDAFLTK